VFVYVCDVKMTVIDIMSIFRTLLLLLFSVQLISAFTAASSNVIAG